jgi:hypothetical protein
LTFSTAGQPLSGEVLASFYDGGADQLAGHYTVTVNWGDGSPDESVTPQQGSPTSWWEVLGSHTYAEAGEYAVTVFVAAAGDGATLVMAATASITEPGPDAWYFTAAQRRDGVDATWLPAGSAEVSQNLGDVRLFHSLDLDLSPGTSVGGEPALVYHSGTVDVRPVVEGVVVTDPLAGLPDTLEVHFTFAGGPEQVTTFGVPEGALWGEPLLVSARPDDPVTATGVYAWTMYVVAKQGPAVVSTTDTLEGLAYAVVRDNGSSPFGDGWWLSTLHRLVPYTEAGELKGMLLVLGTGEALYFTANADGTFTSPPGEAVPGGAEPGPHADPLHPAGPFTVWPDRPLHAPRPGGRGARRSPAAGRRRGGDRRAVRGIARSSGGRRGARLPAPGWHHSCSSYHQPPLSGAGAVLRRQ